MKTEAPAQEDGYKPRYVDIGINLADPIFRGISHGRRRHPDDLDAVVGRAREVGCSKLLVTGSDFRSSRDALKLTKDHPGVIYSTIGIHPCSSSIFSTAYSESDDAHIDPDPSKPMPEHHLPDPDRTEAIISELKDLISTTRESPSGLVAFGEFGLDYDRLHYCSKVVQIHSFVAQLEVAASLQPQLPLFLHSRAAHEDFVSLLKQAFGPKLERLEKGGVVHSFTGTMEEAKELMDLGLYIGINGCSFKTAENCEVVKEIDLDLIMLETDGPWCEIRPSHEGYKYLLDATKADGVDAVVDGPEQTPKAAPKPKKNQKKEPAVPERWKVVKKEKWVEGAMVKGRNEPCMIERVAKVVAGIKGISVEEVCEAAWRNSIKVFGLDDEGAR
ncbi:hypothetical protein ACRALDRAFT_1060352 [Sodiomyces alcalophilus JCM 7366]|uniref:uncharacterized protein n=1 Tax=Sodiomyces alcalophilus JCM 7366 TaxID=591952 RepID=UPI0039B453C6